MQHKEMFRPLQHRVMWRWRCGRLYCDRCVPTRTEMRRMDGQADLLHVSQRISVSCTPPPPCATSLETRLTEGCLLHSSLTSTAAQSFSFSETLETSLWRQNSKNTQRPHCHGSSSSCETGEALLSAEMRVSFPQTHRS